MPAWLPNDPKIQDLYSKCLGKEIYESQDGMKVIYHLNGDSFTFILELDNFGYPVLTTILMNSEPYWKGGEWV